MPELRIGRRNVVQGGWSQSLVPTDGRLPLNLSYAMAFAVTMRVWIWHVAHRRLTSFFDTACISEADTLASMPAI